MHVMLLVAGVSLVCLLCLGSGWFFFRRMLLPQAETRLPPSGARPWSRTRAPGPDGSASEVTHAHMDQFNRNVAQTYNAPTLSYGSMPAGFEQAGHGFGPPDHGFAPTQQNYGANPGVPAYAPGGYASHGMPGYTPATHGFAAFADGSVPAAQHVFSPGEASMIPPGSGIFPAVNSDSGVAPASSAFSAMYGLPGDPFSASQVGPSGWLERPGSGQPLPPAGGLVFGSGAELSDPSLSEAMRQYGQPGEAIQPRMSPQPETPAKFQHPDWLK
jgi:hypothetical protein